MKIITVLAQKGGTGKTTLSIHLAVAAAEKGLKTLIADVDSQGSSAFWRKRRGRKNPVVLDFSAKALKGELKALQKAEVDLLIIDTAPHSTEEAIRAVKMADYVIIPSRPAILDLSAIGDSVEIVIKAGVSGAIVLNCCPPPHRSGETAIVKEARKALETYGLPVALPSVAQRAAFSHALIDGRAVTELEKNGKAADEIRKLFKWIMTEVRG